MVRVSFEEDGEFTPDYLQILAYFLTQQEICLLNIPQKYSQDLITHPGGQLFYITDH